MYKNIVFDFGGVMVDFDPKEYLVDRFCNADVEEQVSALTFDSEEWKLLDAGLITRFEANQRMLAKAREQGCAFEVQGVLDDWMHILRPRRRMQELVQKLKAHGYCVYYLSNIPEDVLAACGEVRLPLGQTVEQCFVAQGRRGEVVVERLVAIFGHR